MQETRGWSQRRSFAAAAAVAVVPLAVGCAARGAGPGSGAPAGATSATTAPVAAASASTLADYIAPAGAPVAAPAGFLAGISGGRLVASRRNYQDTGVDLAPVPLTTRPAISQVQAYDACLRPEAHCRTDIAPTVTFAVVVTAIGTKAADGPLPEWVLTWTGYKCRLLSGGPPLSPGATGVPDRPLSPCSLISAVDPTTGTVLWTTQSVH